MSIGALAIRPLEMRPEVASRLADWFVAEWPEYHRGKTLADVAGRFRLIPDVQETLIAELDGEAVGTIALRGPWDAAPEIPPPWLGGLFVAPDFRGQGIARVLIDEAVAQATRAGHETVHIAVRIDPKSFTEREWRVVGTLSAGGDAVTVLRKDLAG